MAYAISRIYYLSGICDLQIRPDLKNSPNCFANDFNISFGCSLGFQILPKY